MTKTLSAEGSTTPMTIHSKSSKNARGARANLMQSVRQHRPQASSIDYTQTPITEVYGSNVFNRVTMRTLLPKSIYKAITTALDNGERLDPAMADVVANAMKDWAVAKGATHFCHWFLPMTGLTAEKHDAFVTPTADDKALVEFSGNF